MLYLTDKEKAVPSSPTCFGGEVAAYFLNI